MLMRERNECRAISGSVRCEFHIEPLHLRLSFRVLPCYSCERIAEQIVERIATPLKGIRLYTNVHTTEQGGVADVFKRRKTESALHWLVRFCTPRVEMLLECLHAKRAKLDCYFLALYLSLANCYLNKCNPWLSA